MLSTAKNTAHLENQTHGNCNPLLIHLFSYVKYLVDIVSFSIVKGISVVKIFLYPSICCGDSALKMKKHSKFAASSII